MKRFPLSFGTIPRMVTIAFFCLLSASFQTAHAGRNAGGALIVHTNDAVNYSAGRDYCGAYFDDPGTCEAAGTRTDKDEDTPAVIWFLAAFPDTSSPAVTALRFGIDHNLPAGEGYFASHHMCGAVEIPEVGWPETGFGNAVAFATVVHTEHLFPFYWFAAYGFQDAHLGTRTDPRTGAASIADDSNPPIEDAVTRFGTVRWYAAGSNDCPGDGGGEGQGGDSAGGSEDETENDHWLDGDGQSQWVRDCILVQLRDDLPMPRREPVQELGIPAFDELSQQLGLVSAKRMLFLSDESCSRYSAMSRVVKLRFRSGTDEVAVARQYEQLPEVLWAQPDYAWEMGFFDPQANDPGFRRQWHLDWTGQAKSCADSTWQVGCAPECDIGLDSAWVYTRGDSSVHVAFMDSGADMQHPDLFGAYLVNLAEDDGDGVVELCPADSLGDLNGVDEDSNGVADDILLGYRFFYPDSTHWYQPRIKHGTKVAGILGAITNNGRGTASAAGGDAANQRPGVRLIQFSAYSFNTTSNLVNSFYYAHSYGARIYSSSSVLEYPEPDTAITNAVAYLGGSMLFIQAAGNSNEAVMGCSFAREPGVMAVGGYDCSGGRWVIPGKYQQGNFRGSNYGEELTVMGPADDDSPAGYKRMVLASTDVTSQRYVCRPNTADGAVGCFGGTSAAAPTVASVAALIFSYSDEQNLGLTASQVRTILEHTAEDIQCDTLLVSGGCDCGNPNPPGHCAVDLLGWDRYTGFGRVDAEPVNDSETVEAII